MEAKLFWTTPYASHQVALTNRDSCPNAEPAHL
jgi:hypothetical protein